jgi:DNA-binding transcriptional MerR regulator
MGIDIAVPAHMAARRAAISLSRLRGYEEAGLAVPSERSDAGTPLYTGQDVERVVRARQLEDAIAFTTNQLKRLLAAADVVASRRDALRATGDRLEKRTILAEALAELDDLRTVMSAKLEGIADLDARLAAWEDELRDLPAGR